jgi:hypothetical protein
VTGLDKILFHSIRFSNELDSNLLSQLLVSSILLGHHPLIGKKSLEIWKLAIDISHITIDFMASGSQTWNWHKIVMNAGLYAKFDTQFLYVHYGRLISDIVSGPMGLNSSLASQREAAIRAMMTLIRLNADYYIPIFLAVLLERIDRKELNTFSEADIKIFHTPEGQICFNGSFIIYSDIINDRFRWNP